MVGHPPLEPNGHFSTPDRELFARRKGSWRASKGHSGYRPPVPRYRVTPWILLLGGIFGLLAAFQLTLEKFAIVADPDYSPGCDINPVLACGSVIVTEQAEAFGFPNPIIGLISYSVVITIAVLLIAKVELPRWVWLGLNAGCALRLRLRDLVDLPEPVRNRSVVPLVHGRLGSHHPGVLAGHRGQRRQRALQR